MTVLKGNTAGAGVKATDAVPAGAPGIAAHSPCRSDIRVRLAIFIETRYDSRKTIYRRDTLPPKEPETVKQSLEDKIQREIRRRAFERADIDARIREQTRHTVAALQEVTGLSEMQLKSIADEVRRQYDPTPDKFFSTGAQLLIVLAGLATLGLLVWVLF